MTQKQYTEAFNKIVEPYGLKVISTKSHKNMAALSTKQVTFSNNLLLLFQQPKIDTTAFEIVMNHKIKNILVINRETYSGKTTVVCIDLDNPSIGFISSKTLLNSLVDNNIVNVANMKNTKAGVSYLIKVDDKIRDFRNQLSQNGKWIPAFLTIVKAGDFYVMTDIFDENPSTNTFTVPDFVDFIALGTLYKAVYTKTTTGNELQIINNKVVVCNILNAEQHKKKGKIS